MGDFVTTALSLPTVLFTVPLLLSVLYWLFVVMGAVDLDALDALDGADGLLDGAGEGGLDGLDAAFDSFDAGMEPVDALDGLDPDGANDGHSPGALAALLSTLKLTTVPLTVSLSFVTLFAWLTSFLLTVHVAPLIPLPVLLSSVAIAGLAVVAGALGASLSVRPLGGLFHTERGRGNRSFIGSVVIINTGKVTDRFGQAELTERDHHLIVQVRDPADQNLTKDDRALLIRWDKAGEAFMVEKLDVAAADGDIQAARQDAIDRIRARVAHRKSTVSKQ